MKFTQEWIEGKAANPAVFSRALSFYRSRPPIEYTASHPQEGVLQIEARILEEGKTYEAKVEIEEKSTNSTHSCNCGGFHMKFGACKHVLAALLQVHEDQKRNRLNIKDEHSLSEDSMNGIIDKYRLMNSQPQGRVRLVPRLLMSGNRIKLELAIGINRLYQVKDLYKFAYDLVNRSWTEYGKELSFCHHEDAFLENSRPLAALAVRLVQEGELYGESTFGKNHRYLELTPAALDDFFEAAFGEEAEADGNPLTLIADNPPLEIILEPSLTISLRPFKLFKGAKSLFFFHQQSLYRLDPGFGRRLEPLLAALAREEATPFEIPLQRDSLGKFVNYVLPSIREFSREASWFERLSQPPLELLFYLDSQRKNQVLAKVVFKYGKKELPSQEGEAGFMDPYLIRDLDSEKAALEQLGDLGFELAGHDYELQGEEAYFYFLQEGTAVLQSLGMVYISEKLRSSRIRELPAYGVDVSLSKGVLDLSFDGLDLEEEAYGAILAAYRQKKKYIRLEDGSFIDLEKGSAPKLAAFLDDFSLEFKDGRMGAASFQAIYMDRFLKDTPDLCLTTNESFDKLIQAFGGEGARKWHVPEQLEGVLRAYQETGYHWLRTLAAFGFGGILADDMGLGKTIQVIALLLAEKNSSRTSLIVTPSSLMYNWKRELERFAPQLRSLIVRGAPEYRRELLEDYQAYDVIITSYDLIRRDGELYTDRQFRYCILDEAQYIKNQATLGARAVKQVPSDAHFALTGTPIENSLSDLWSIFDFLMPGYLGTYQTFKKKYELPIVRDGKKELLSKLHQQVAPFIMRRLKSDVLKELPEKIETSLYCEMDREQENLYKATLYQMRSELEKSFKLNGQPENRMMILAQLMRLRQICCHPSLFLEDYHGESAKYELCFQLIEDCLATGKKILIFSQFTSMLDLIGAELEKRGVPFYLLTGSTRPEKRVVLAEAFNQDETPLFLISLKAGGTGLNLTGAEVVIHFDPWWNQAVQNQATDRAHRLGQHKRVQVFKLITKDSIEEKIEELQKQKGALTDSIVKEGEVFINRLNDEQLRALFD